MRHPTSGHFVDPQDRPTGPRTHLSASYAETFPCDSEKTDLTMEIPEDQRERQTGFQHGLG